MAFFISQDIIYDYVDFDGELVNVVKLFCLDGTTRIKQQLAQLIKPSESKQPDYKILQRDMKAYRQTELVYDVYCDRVNFIGTDSFSAYVTFFNNRGIIFNRDRAGYSIDIKDAQKIGLPVEFSTYRLLPDSRKKPIVMNKAKVTLLDELLAKSKQFKDNGEKIDYYLVNPVKSFKYCQIWYSNPTGNDDDRTREGYIIKNTYPSSIQKYLKDSSRGTTKVFTDIFEAENKCLEIDDFASKIHG